MTRLPAVCFALILIALAGPAFAGPFDLSWAALDPGDDWSAQMIKSVFPVNGAPPLPTGTAATVIGQIIGQLTGFVAAIAMFYVCYTTIMHIHRVAESSQILTNSMTSMFLVRIGFAAIMMFPLASGFSTGQAAVVQASMWGIGMAKNVYTNAVTAIGPDAMVIAEPMIPGTETIVLNLLQDELCRALINKAANSPPPPNEIVPVPTPTQVVNAYGGGVVTWSYSMAAGSETGAPVCGTVTLTQPVTAGSVIGGVNTDMTATQRTILESIVANDIRPAVEVAATKFWNTKQASALNQLQNTYSNASADYTQQLTNAATNISNQLRTAMQAQDARDGNLGLIQAENKLSALGWTAAGAYYLEFARLNGVTLSLLSSTPVVNMPSYDGLSQALKNDLAPLLTSETAFLTRLGTYVRSTDGLDTPSGNANLFTGVTVGKDGNSTIEQIFRSINLTEPVLHFFTDQMSPTGNQWTDPFGGLMTLGNRLIVAAMTAFGLAALASSDAGTAAATILNTLTLNWGAAAATVAAHEVIKFLSTPIYMAISGLLFPGLTIAFILPMIPWVMWMGGVAGYLILVCEAVIAVPLWMLAHMTFEGGGLHGRAGAGYELIFNVLFRPVLMLLGLFLGYFIFTAMSWLIRMSFGIAAGFVLHNGSLVTNFLGLFVLLFIYVMTHVTAAIMSFQLISLIPHHLPKLLGFSSANRVDMNQFGKDAALAGAGGAIASLQQGFQHNGLLGRYSAARLGYNGTRQLIGPSRATRGGGTGGTRGANMDSTLHASTDTSHRAPPEPQA